MYNKGRIHHTVPRSIYRNAKPGVQKVKERPTADTKKKKKRLDSVKEFFHYSKNLESYIKTL